MGIRRFISFTSFTLCIFSLIGTLKAQVSQVSLPINSSTASNALPAQASNYQLAVKVRRVVLDVVVTDAKGRPVEGLKQDDFKVMEDGAIQPVHFFDVHGVPTANTSQQPAIDLHLPVDTFSNLALAPADRPVTILVYDLLNTPQPALQLAHQALVKFIKDQKSSTKIAIFVLSDRLHMLQGFTDDETRLIEAVDSKKSATRVSLLRVSDTGEDAASLLAADPNANATPGQTQAPSSADSVLAMLADAEDAEKNFLLQQRLRITVHAFTEVARFVSSLPGRKNLIWMSGAFPMEIWPSRTQSADGMAGSGAFSVATPLDRDIRAAQEVLKESRVAIYPVDVRGLQVDPQYAASTRVPTMPPKGSSRAPMPPPKASFGIKLAGEHATMDALADTTGGRAFYNTNGLQEAMDAAARQGSEYYTLTYAPTNSRDDGGERAVKVVLANPDYQLSYRRRYLAQDAGRPASLQPVVFDENMQHGAPDSTELFFEARVTPVGATMAASTAELENLEKSLQTNSGAVNTKIGTGPINVQHYDIDLAIIARQLQMPQTADGKYATAMRFGLAAYTQDSELLNSIQGTVKSSIPAAQYQKIQLEGYHRSMKFVVPDEAVSLRIAVQDEIGNRIGTMEIPLPVPVPKNTAAASATTK